MRQLIIGLSLGLIFGCCNILTSNEPKEITIYTAFEQWGNRVSIKIITDNINKKDYIVVENNHGIAITPRLK